jgi:hypothetical protein
MSPDHDKLWCAATIIFYFQNWTSVLPKSTVFMKAISYPVDCFLSVLASVRITVSLYYGRRIRMSIWKYKS